MKLSLAYIILALLISNETISIKDNEISQKAGEQNKYKLDPTLAPSENFDLTSFKLTIPTDEDTNGKSDNISEKKLNKGYQSEYFYTAKDGGMVFKCPSHGTTTPNSNYVRVELREMLRKGDKSIKAKGVNKNNWVFSSAPVADQKAAGAVDGEMKATLAVNHVTTTGKKNHIGRLIIGQIHANSDEPIRLYYRKLKDNDLGSIYFAHEIFDGDDTYYEIIGGGSGSLDNPIDGIALNEKFSYTIKVVGNTLNVTLSREGKEDIVKVVDMSESGYDKGGAYQFFKAGIYHVNNTADKDDYAQVTFYDLEVIH